MDAPVGSLEAQITAAFRHACANQDWTVAELLLEALEALAAREGRERGSTSANSKLDDLA